MLQEKKCLKCGETKSISEFYKDTSCNDGISNRCKICDSNKCKDYLTSKKGLVSKIYNSQKLSSKRRSHNLPKYTLSELRDWCFSQPLFHKLFIDWEKDGFSRSLSPSCDRKNDHLPYALDNLQLMTAIDNIRKGHSDRKNGTGTQGYLCKAVIGTHKVTNNKVEYHSVSEAARMTGAGQGHISSCCSGIKWCKSAGGYYWEYKEEQA